MQEAWHPVLTWLNLGMPKDSYGPPSIILRRNGVMWASFQGLLCGDNKLEQELHPVYPTSTTPSGEL
ncbi:MAG: hypothetical protein OEZ06_32750 [Myxococcales bacterium]|nr:hypothetical protein [Myxococcales bacterium]